MSLKVPQKFQAIKLSLRLFYVWSKLSWKDHSFSLLIRVLRSLQNVLYFVLHPHLISIKHYSKFCNKLPLRILKCNSFTLCNISETRSIFVTIIIITISPYWIFLFHFTNSFKYHRNFTNRTNKFVRNSFRLNSQFLSIYLRSELIKCRNMIC